MGHHDDRLAELAHRLAQERQHLGARARVEVAGGLVGEDDLRLAGERPGRRHPLLLAARQLVRPVLQAGPQADRVDDVVDPRLVELAAGEGGGQGDVLRGGQGRHQVEGLEDEADPVAPQLGQALVVEGAEVGVADERSDRRSACRGRPGSASASTCRSPTGP